MKRRRRQNPQRALGLTKQEDIGYSEALGRVLHEYELVMGQKFMAKVLGISNRQLRRLKTAGELGPIHGYRLYCGGKPRDSFYLRDGLALRKRRARKVRQTRIRNLGDRAKKGVRRPKA